MVDPLLSAILGIWIGCCADFFGRLTKKKHLYGPGGINVQGMKGDSLALAKNPFGNIFMAARAMARDPSLKKYNPEWTPAYLGEIKRVAAKLRKERDHAPVRVSMRRLRHQGPPYRRAG